MKPSGKIELDASSANFHARLMEALQPGVVDNGFETISPLREFKVNVDGVSCQSVVDFIAQDGQLYTLVMLPEKVIERKQGVDEEGADYEELTLQDYEGHVRTLRTYLLAMEIHIQG